MCACSGLACSGLSSSDDFVPTEEAEDSSSPDSSSPDSSPDSSTDSSSPDSSSDSTPDPDTKNPNDTQDGLTETQITGACAILCSKLQQCPDTTGLPSTLDCLDVCVSSKSDNPIPNSAQFGCFIDIASTGFAQGFDPTQGNYDFCPLLDLTPLRCPSVISCVQSCGQLQRDCCDGQDWDECTDINMQRIGTSCVDACILNATNAIDDTIYACYVGHRDLITDSTSKTEEAVLCALSDGLPETPNVACDDPCTTLCQTLPIACENHPIRAAYGIETPSGEPTIEDLNACQAFCRTRFFEDTEPTPLTYAPLSNQDDLACRLHYLVQALILDDENLCAFADPDPAAACSAQPIDFDADSLIGASDPCPYVYGTTCTTNYCSASSPDCDGNSICNNLQIDPEYCGSCAPTIPCEGATPCTQGQCATPCDATAESACNQDFTCIDGFCIACTESAGACPQGPLCGNIQCDADQLCSFGACVPLNVTCGSLTCGPLESCTIASNACTCGSTLSTSKSACPTQSLCLDGACVPAPSCGSNTCQPGEICDLPSNTCLCNAGPACPLGQYCNTSNGTCAPISP